MPGAVFIEDRSSFNGNKKIAVQYNRNIFIIKPLIATTERIIEYTNNNRDNF